jgi:hypothetical protein
MKGHILNYALIINVFLGFETLKMFLCSLVSQPDLNGNPFFGDGKAKAKKDWEWKAEIAVIKINRR